MNILNSSWGAAVVAMLMMVVPGAALAQQAPATVPQPVPVKLADNPDVAAAEIIGTLLTLVLLVSTSGLQ